MKTIFCLLLFFILNGSLAKAEIEVYSAGKHFSSFEDYQKDKDNVVEKSLKPLDPVSRPRQIVIPIKDRKRLDKMSYDNAVHHIVVDFQQNWQNPKPRFIMDVDELQDSIREALKSQKGPVLLVSDPKKMRMMSYVTNQHSTVDINKLNNLK